MAILLVVAGCGLAAGHASGQSSSGTISGFVRDSQSAVIPDAAVTITNTATGNVVRTRTNSQGFYSAAALQAGSYLVKVEKAGFGTQAQLLDVAVGGETEGDALLKPGEVQGSIVVNAEPQEALNTEDAAVVTSVSHDITSQIPLPERSALEVVSLSAGVQGDPGSAGGIVSENPGPYTGPITPGAALAIAGGRPGTVSQLVDGFDITLSAYPRAGITFSGDSVHSVTVQQNGLQAQYGRNGGGIVNQVTTGGTSRYHGLLLYRHYDPFFEAWTYGGAASFSPPDARQNLFTIAFGGPVPGKLFKRTFFYASYEPLRVGSTLFSQVRVPTPDELAGRFQNSLDLLNSTTLRTQGYAAAAAAPHNNLYYQFTLNAQGFPNSGRVSSSAYVQVPNNDLSAQVAQNPLATFIAANSPTPANPGPYVHFLYPDAHYANDGNNAVGARAVKNADNRYTVRVDHTFPNYDSLSLRFTIVPVSGERYDYLGPNSVLNDVPSDAITSTNGAIGYTHIFGNNEVNEARVSYLRSDHERNVPQASLAKDFGGSLGLTPAIRGAGFPILEFISATGINGLNELGSGGTLTDGGRSIDVNFGVGDDFSLLLGKHSIRFGVDYRALQLDRTDISDLYGGNYEFSDSETSNGTSGGSGLASLDLGLISSFALQGYQPYYYRWKYFAGYLQDSFRAGAKVTLNYGVRYNLETPRSEAHGLQGVFSPGATGTVTNAVTNQAVPVTGGLVLSGTGGLQKTLWPTNYRELEPRVGIAAAPARFVTTRASYGLVHLPLTGNSDSVIPNLSAGSFNVGGAAGGTNPAAYVDYITNPVSAAVPTTITTTPNFTFSSSGYLPFVSQRSTGPYVQLWSASVQFRLGKGGILEVAYSGSRGLHLFTEPVATNIPQLNQLTQGIAVGAPFSSTVTNAVTGVSESYLQSLNPYQQFYNNPIDTALARTSQSDYNGLLVNYHETLGRHLSIISSFTWSKSLDNNSSGAINGASDDSFGLAEPQTPYTLVGEYSPSTYDLPVRTTGAYVLTLPIGRGERININSRWLNALAGDWRTSGIFSAMSGYPIWTVLNSNAYFISTAPGSAVIGGNGPAIEDANLRPSLVPGQRLIQPNWKQDPFGLNGGGYLNPNAFTTPGSPGNPQLGDAPRTLSDARNPRIIYYDASVRKGIPLRGDGRVRLELRLDAINAMNHTNFFFNPGVSSGHRYSGSFNSANGQYSVASNFGVLVQASNTPGRTLAVGAALTF
jgi:hypothetical protein